MEASASSVIYHVELIDGIAKITGYAFWGAMALIGVGLTLKVTIGGIKLRKGK